MNVLVVGHGTGSWAIRGVQLGRALGARVVSAPSDDDLRWADVVVLVKRAAATWAALVQRFDKPIVWDALDFWSQPGENALTEAEARALLRQQIATIQPAAVIGATEAMADAAGGLYLPHHHRHTQGDPWPVADTVATVAYEGNPAYLGRWRGVIDRACALRGWRFVINPDDLRIADLILAVRDGVWDGWMCREWKSGVKVVNALAVGRPLITQHSAAVREIAPCVTFVETFTDLDNALDAWVSWHERSDVARIHAARARTYRLDALAPVYRAHLAAAVAQKGAYVHADH